MQKYGIEPKFINLEITETASIDGGELLDMNMKRLRSLGCHFSMDDFGTGYSNLAQMAKVRFELVKLDKSLIDYIGNSGGDQLIRHAIALAKDLGMHVTAEGVEDEKQVAFLRRLKCDSIQGFFYSRPLSEQEFEKRFVFGEATAPDRE